ncbi:MAG: O-antigen ligase family protein [Hyphomicrobiaceae bacterium]
MLPGLLVMAAFLSPRFIALAGFALAGAAAFGDLKTPARRPRAMAATVLLTLLGVWAAASALWSPDPAAALQKGVVLVGLVVLTALGAERLTTSDPERLHRALWISAAAVVAGTCLVAIELVTDQWIYRTVLSMLPGLAATMKKHVAMQDGLVFRVSESEINRRTTLAIALCLPAFGLLYAAGPARWRTLLTGAGLIAVVGILLTAYHQSSQAAILAAAITLALAGLSLRWTARMLAVAWIVATLLVVPMVTGAYRAELHKADWIFYTARHRIVIWDFMAERVGNAPLRGIGAEAARVLHETVDRETLEAHQRNAGVGVSTALHAHNIYLQVWYELGAVGAALLCAAGLALLGTATRLAPGTQRLALAQFAVTATMAAFSYGLWQAWFQVAFAIGLLGISAIALFDRGRTAH